jgi:hypothetical protein
MQCLFCHSNYFSNVQDFGANQLRIISKLVDQIFYEGLTRAREERRIAPQASAGYPLSINSLLAFRKKERGQEKKASMK